MDFEYDLAKSKKNDDKHGIDFEAAKKLWNDPECLIIPSRTTDEKRYLIIARFNNKIWSGVFTIRKNKIRIISVRRARKNEEEIYKS